MHSLGKVSPLPGIFDSICARVDWDCPTGHRVCTGKKGGAKGTHSASNCAIDIMLIIQAFKLRSRKERRCTWLYAVCVFRVCTRPGRMVGALPIHPCVRLIVNTCLICVHVFVHGPVPQPWPLPVALIMRKCRTLHIVATKPNHDSSNNARGGAHVHTS